MSGELAQLSQKWIFWGKSWSEGKAIQIPGFKVGRTARLRGSGKTLALLLGAGGAPGQGEGVLTFCLVFSLCVYEKQLNFIFHTALYYTELIPASAKLLKWD